MNHHVIHKITQEKKNSTLMKMGGSDDSAIFNSGHNLKLCG